MNMIRIIQTALIGALMVLPGLCLAAEEAATEKPDALDSGSVIVEIITALGAVTFCIFLMAWVAKRLGAGTMLQPKGMRLLATMSLSAKEKVVLIEVEHTKILLGVAAGNVSRLHVFEPSEEDEIKDETPEVDEEQVRSIEEKWDFARYLKGVIKDGNRQ